MKVVLSDTEVIVELPDYESCKSDNNIHVDIFSLQDSPEDSRIDMHVSIHKETGKILGVKYVSQDKRNHHLLCNAGSHQPIGCAGCTCDDHIKRELEDNNYSLLYEMVAMLLIAKYTSFKE